MSTPNTYYLAVSLGPMVDTLLAARKTRELWAASTLFSTLMRELIRAAMKNNVDVWSPLSPGTYDVNTDTLAPASPPPSEADPDLYGTGVYPDRLYGAYQPEQPMDFAALDAHFVKIKTETLVKLAPLLAKDGAEVADFYADYFRIVHAWLPDSDASVNLLFDLNDLLDTLELQPATLSQQNLRQNRLNELLDKPYRAPAVRDGLRPGPGSIYSPITAAVANNGKALDFDFFPSTAQIASLDLYYRDEDNKYKALLDFSARQTNLSAPDSIEALESGDADDPRSDNQVLQEFYRQLDNGGPHPAAVALTEKVDGLAKYQEFHKYFCIVHADGDRFGKVIAGLGNDDTAIKKFSGKLANFAKAAAKTINQYGGKPIYIGGDDLVFFAPVVFRECTVFDCLEALDEVFRVVCPLTPQPTLSYGITLSHYKYPLFEAKDQSFNAMYAAKGMKWQRGQQQGSKDAVCFRLVRHAGSFFTGYLDKTLLKKFNQIRKDRLEDEDFLSSFTYKLRELEPLIEAIGPQPGKARLGNLIDNFFDEPIHDEKRAALDKLLDFYLAVTGLQLTVSEDDFSARDNLYALLRLMAFTLPKKKPAHVIA
jgi:CRISPR-associated protein Cmr2